MENMKKKVSYTVLLLLLLVSQCLAQPPDYVFKVSTQYVTALGLEDNKNGSGTLLDNGMILTAAHLFPDGAKKLTIVVANDYDAHSKCRLVLIDRYNDFAVLRPLKTLGKGLKLSPHQYGPGYDFENWGCRDGEPFVYRRGYIAAKNLTQYLVDCTIGSGDSGSAIISDNQIVGVVSGITQPKYGDWMGVIVRSDYIYTVLKEKKIVE